MKKAMFILMAATAIGAVGAALLTKDSTPLEDLRPALIDDTCQVGLDCVGGMFQRNKGCLCITDNPNTLPDEVTDVNNLPANMQLRLIGCCDSNDNKTVRWQPITDPLGTCIQLIGPHLFAGDSMKNIDLENVDPLNAACCDSGEVVAAKGSWGQCPYCMYGCNPAHNPYITPGGCDAYCYVPNGG